MTFNWSINSWVKTMIPAAIRKQSLTDYVLVLISQLISVYTDFINLRAILKKKMRFNGQVIVLENLLNDTFDNSIRRIRIITLEDLLRKKYIGQTIENKPLWIGQPSELYPQYIGQWIEYMNQTGFDITVEVPSGVYTTEQLLQIKKLTNTYKLAGKRAKFIYQNGTEF